MDRARKAFAYADVEGKNFLTKHQFKVAMTAVFGYCPEKSYVKMIFARATSPEGSITLDEFQKCVRKRPDVKNAAVDPEFLFMRLDKDIKGYLVLEDLLTAAKEVNLRKSTAIIESAFKELDRCRRGFIGMDEFIAMMRDREL